MHVFMIGFILIAILSGWFVLWKVPIISSKTTHKQLDKKVSIILPARDEENNLPIILESLNNQNTKPHEIIVVDDDSSDRTAEVAMAWGAEVIHYAQEALGWSGKSAACWAGAHAATGDWLLFLDADVYLPNEESLENILRAFERQENEGALSIQPYHTIQSLYENLSVLFNIIVLAGMNRFSILKDRLNPAGAFGPSLLIDRKLYFETSGHKLVKDSMMENIDFGHALLQENLPVHLYSGVGALHFRMYPEGLESLSEGWSKSFATGSKSTHPLVLIGISLWISGAFFAFAYLIFGLFLGNPGIFLLAFVNYLLYFLQFYRMANLAGNFRGWLLFFYPVFFIYFVGLFAWSAVKTFIFRSVSWKGRSIDV